MFSCEDTDERAPISVRRAIVLVATARGPADCRDWS